MGLRKVADVPAQGCSHPEHAPPLHMVLAVLAPGVYDYTCPGCGRTVRFHVVHSNLEA